MSAIIVLILRILLVVCIYSFLGIALLALWQELRKSSKEQEALSHPKITIDIDGKSIKQYAQAEIMIGRGEENDIRFQDETISLQHARIFYFNNNWMVEDSHSTNGTFLNGETIHSPVVMIDGDRIEIGGKTLNVSFHTEPDAS